MGKPSKLSGQLGRQYDIIKSSIINTLFQKLEEIRLYHATSKPSGFSNVPQSFNTNITSQNNIITTNYPTKIKEYITALEQSRYIPDNIYSNRIHIPDVNDLITASQYLIEDIQVINELTALDANCTANYTSDYKSNNTPVYSGDYADGGGGGGGSSGGGGGCPHACGSNWCSADCVN